MPAGALTPITRWQVLDNGVIAPGAKAYFYASGTNTPLAVYTDAALTVAHAHPVVADAEGVLPVIYLQALAYRLLVTDSAGATIFPAQDNVYAIPEAAVQAANLVYAGPTSGAAAVPTFRALVAADLPNVVTAQACQGRLTLTSGVAVTSADVTGAGTLYFTPYQGNSVALYSGTAWVSYTLTERSLALVVTANTNYDVFLYDNAGTLTLELTAWTNDTTRATALVSQDGVLVKSGATTRRYLGTIRASGSNVTEDSAAKRFVWNVMNRVSRTVRVLEATNSWTYTTATWRQANNAAANQIAVVAGLSEDAISVLVSAESATNSSAIARVAIGEDSTSAPSANSVRGGSNTAGGTSSTNNPQAFATIVPAIGYHYFAWLEWSTATGTTTWYGDNGGTDMQSGMSGLWRA